MDQEKTGLLIRNLRQARGLTQLQLAREIGVSDQAVSKWERGLGFPDVSLLPTLARPLTWTSAHYWRAIFPKTALSTVTCARRDSSSVPNAAACSPALAKQTLPAADGR